MTQIENIVMTCPVTGFQLEQIAKDVQVLTTRMAFCNKPVILNIHIGKKDVKDNLLVMLVNKEGNYGWEKTYPQKLNYVAVDGCGFVNLGLTDEIANACYHSGSCDYDTEVYLDAPIIREQLDKITDEQIIKSLNECGIDEYNPSEHTRRENEAWALFLAAANYKEDKAAGYFDNED